MITSKEKQPADPLLGGFYTTTQAVRLLKISDGDHSYSKHRIYRWLKSSGDDKYPVIVRDYEPTNYKQELSFWDLIEVRFVEHFRHQGLSLQYLRKVAEIARQEFGTKHPFALSKAVYLTDRRKIFERTAEQGGPRVRELLSGQFEMYETIEDTLAEGISFNPNSLLAEEWRPLRKICPNVLVNPRFSFGQPVIGKHKVPTEAIHRQWIAEQQNVRHVSFWWKVSESEVEEAIEFERRLAA